MGSLLDIPKVQEYIDRALEEAREELLDEITSDPENFSLRSESCENCGDTDTVVICEDCGGDRWGDGSDDEHECRICSTEVRHETRYCDEHMAHDLNQMFECILQTLKNRGEALTRSQSMGLAAAISEHLSNSYHPDVVSKFKSTHAGQVRDEARSRYTIG